MKRIIFLFFILLLCGNTVFADETIGEVAEAEQVIEMTQNKIIVNVQKQPLNENSKQKIVMKKNWFVVNIQVNGKVKTVYGTVE